MHIHMCIDIDTHINTLTHTQTYSDSHTFTHTQTHSHRFTQIKVCHMCHSLFVKFQAASLISSYQQLSSVKFDDRPVGRSVQIKSVCSRLSSASSTGGGDRKRRSSLWPMGRRRRSYNVWATLMLRSDPRQLVKSQKPGPSGAS